MSDNQTTSRRRASSERAVQAPVTEQVLRGFEKSEAAKHVMVKRIINALRGAWQTVAEKEEALWREQDERRKDNEQRDKQAVLVVVHVDGWIDIYADRGTNVGTLELSIVDSEDECEWQKKVPYSLKHLLNRTPTRTAFPRYLNRPNQFTDESLARALEHIGRIERDNRIREWAEQALERAKPCP